MFTHIRCLYRPAVQASALHLFAIALLVCLSVWARQQVGSSVPQNGTDAVLMLVNHQELPITLDTHSPMVLSDLDTFPTTVVPSEIDISSEPVSRPVPQISKKNKVKEAVSGQIEHSDLSKALSTQGAQELPVEEGAQPQHDLNISPDYPITLRQRGIEGTVWLRVHVDHSGLPEQIILFKSSGYRLFDEAALRAVARWRFKPAKSYGRHLASWVEFPVRFILQG